MDDLQKLKSDIANCRICAERFAATHTGHEPRPVVWFDRAPRIVIHGQAPGLRVHKSGRPFDDPSGDRLRDWMGIDAATFYDMARIAIVPMAFCFPGYNAAGSDLPPPKICAQTFYSQFTAKIQPPKLTLLVGGYAQKWHMGVKTGVTDTVLAWRDHAPRLFPLPHPSWRNTAWIKKNPWFETDLLPALRHQVNEALNG